MGQKEEEEETLAEALRGGWALLEDKASDSATAFYYDSPEDPPFVLTKADCQAISNTVNWCLSSSSGFVVGLAFSTLRPSILGLYPSLLAAVKAGAVPLCLDPSASPAEWTKQAVRELKVRSLLADDCSLEEARQAFGEEVTTESSVVGEVAGSKIWHLRRCPEKDSQECGADRLLLRRNNVAYVVQTSGTTGRRKTVFVTAPSFVSNMRDFLGVFSLGPSDRVLCASPPTFDPSYLDLFCSFASGAALVFLRADLKSSPSAAMKVIEKSRPTFAQMTPTLFGNLMGSGLRQLLLSDSNPLSSLVLGGEKFPILPPELLLPDSPCRTRFFNAYGVTEMSVWQSLVRVTAPSLSKGVPIASLDSGDNLISKTKLELTEDGEICVSSSERICFISEDGDSCLKDESLRQRPYRVRTGDLGRVEGGRLYHAGRKEGGFVKARGGKRIGLEEAAALLASASALSPAPPVVCLEDKGGDGELAAFFAGVDEDKEQAVKEGFRKLPGYLRPRRTIFVREFPMTSHGKVDFDKLGDLLEASAAEARLKGSLEDLWLELTGKRPRKESNFLRDGGDSFLAVRLLDSLQEHGVLDRPRPELIGTILDGTFGELRQALNDESEGPNEDTADKAAAVASKEVAKRKRIPHTVRGSRVGEPPRISFPLSDELKIRQEKKPSIFSIFLFSVALRQSFICVKVRN